FRSTHAASSASVTRWCGSRSASRTSTTSPPIWRDRSPRFDAARKSRARAGQRTDRSLGRAHRLAPTHGVVNAKARARVVEEDELLERRRIGLAVLRQLEVHLGGAVRVACEVQSEAIGLDFLGAGDGVR